MTNRQILLANVRILYYKLWNYKPSFEDIINGLEYEYVAVAFKEWANEAKTATSTYEVWKKGKWKSAFGLMKKEHVQKALQKGQIRTKNYLSTDTIKEYINNDTPLEFEFEEGINTVNVIIWGKLVYVNNISETSLRGETNTPTHKLWFNKNLLSETVKSDLRYLLNKDNPRLTPPTNVLYKHLTGVYTYHKMSKKYKDKTNEFDSLLKEVWDTNFKAGEIARIPRKLKKQLKKVQKKVKEVKLFSGFNWRPSPPKYFEKKEVYSKQKESNTRKHISEDRLVCIRSQDKKDVLRIPRKEAIKHVKEKQYVYISKSAYKKFLLGQEEPLRVAKPFTGVTRKTRRYEEHAKDRKPGRSKNNKTLHLVNTRKIKNTQVDEKGYLLNDEEKRVVVKDKRQSFEPVYVMVPIEKRIWEIDPKTGRVKIKDVVPVVNPITKEPLYKRVFDCFAYFYYEYEKFIKVPKRSILT